MYQLKVVTQGGQATTKKYIICTTKTFIPLNTN
jgi:hypothetical protein